MDVAGHTRASRACQPSQVLWNRLTTFCWKQIEANKINEGERKKCAKSLVLVLNAGFLFF